MIALLGIGGFSSEGFPELGVAFLGVPIIRIIVFGVYILGSPDLRKLPSLHPTRVHSRIHTCLELTLDFGLGA